MLNTKDEMVKAIPYSAVYPYIIENNFPQANEFFCIKDKLQLYSFKNKEHVFGAYVSGMEYREMLYKLAKMVKNVKVVNFDEIYGMQILYGMII